MHAVVVTVNIAAGQFESASKALPEVVGRISKAPGFVKGYWSTGPDRRNGLSFVTFKTKEDAENAAKMARSQPTPPGVTLVGAEVREVVAEA